MSKTTQDEIVEKLNVIMEDSWIVYAMSEHARLAKHEWEQVYKQGALDLVLAQTQQTREDFKKIIKKDLPTNPE